MTHLRRDRRRAIRRLRLPPLTHASGETCALGSTQYVLLVTYELEALGERTTLTLRDDAELGAPRLLWPLVRIGIGHDIARQLRALKALLEGVD